MITASRFIHAGTIASSLVMVRSTQLLPGRMFSDRSFARISMTEMEPLAWLAPAGGISLAPRATSRRENAALWATLRIFDNPLKPSPTNGTPGLPSRQRGKPSVNPTATQPLIMPVPDSGNFGLGELGPQEFNGPGKLRVFGAGVLESLSDC